MLLAIDSSTRTIGLALYDGVNVPYESVWHSGLYHTVELSPAIQAALKRLNLQVSDLEALAVATGPGSYTGLRIGLAVAKGLALSGHLPLVGIPTLDILAASQPVQDLPLAAVLEAGRGRLAVGWYQAVDGRWQADGGAEVKTAAQLSQGIKQPTLICGELGEETRRTLRRKHKNAMLASPAQSLRRPAFLAELGWERWQAGQLDDPLTLAPYYLHAGEPIPS